MKLSEVLSRFSLEHLPKELLYF